MDHDQVILGEYFKWLMDKIEYWKDSHRYYDNLMEYLFFSPFVCSISNDENRKEDGLQLRDDFVFESGKNLENELDCSILEVLVALSIRCDRNVIGDPEIIKESKLFWIMLDNLGLTVYDDDRFDVDIVKNIVDNWMFRRFETDGFGSVFPLKYPGRNQKTLEIWFQMQDYLAENFDDEGSW